MIKVHHLNNSRSQRVPWLLEELGVDYEVKRYERDPKTMLAPASLRAVHPLGKSPVGATMLAQCWKRTGMNQTAIASTNSVLATCRWPHKGFSCFRPWLRSWGWPCAHCMSTGAVFTKQTQHCAAAAASIRME